MTDTKRKALEMFIWFVALGLAPAAGAAQQPVQPTQLVPTQQAQPTVQANPKGCIAVQSVGSHAFRNVMLFGVAGAFLSKEQYKVVDVNGYPSRVGQKYHGNDLQTIQGNGTKVVLLNKHYTEDDLRKACQ